MNKLVLVFATQFRKTGRPALVMALLWTASRLLANPQGGTVAQGSATFSTAGTHFTVQTSDKAQINWNSFNIGLGETTTFLQPSSSSVVWNQINDPNASQILGNLNANGYVVLQNPSGFYVGGQAAITAHGIVMTTAATPPPDLSGSGAWQFNTLPPTASIINYGQIRQADGDKGGSIFLIAADVQNNGTISAPQGNIGLYAGKEVLVSSRPDGRGLSARVTLPQGSVDNEGKVIADAGTISMQAQVVNQGGLVQANSMRNVNGVIELVASDSLNLSASSVLSAQGDSASASASQGGFVVVKSDDAYTDASTSAINVSGKTGGRDGLVEIFGNGVTASSVLSQINNKSAQDFLNAQGLLLINPQDLTLSSSVSTPSDSNPNLRMSDLSSFSKIDLFAEGNITISPNSSWTLSGSADPDAALNLTCGQSVSLYSSLSVGNNWNISMSAGPQNPVTKPDNGEGIYLHGGSYMQAQNGDINLWAANEVIVEPILSTSSGIRTLAGGSINVTAVLGDVNTGQNYNGFLFGQLRPPYYKVSQSLGGISTYAGGNVTITAGGSVTSFLPVQSSGIAGDEQFDGGTGAFGAQPGNVTISAGGDISGHYVLANGVGSISSGGNIGAPTAVGGFALSLIKGSWSVLAPDGSIYLQDVRNPNGILNDTTQHNFVGYHIFDYDPLASLSLTAGNSVEITGAGAPHFPASAGGTSVPFIFPPSLRVTAGSGGFVLDTDVILYPSPYGELNIQTTAGGDFRSFVDPNDPSVVSVFSLSMSDSSARQWFPNSGIFESADHAAVPPELNNPNPVELSISGSIKNVNLRTIKATKITVGGDTFNFGFQGENLHVSDVTSINVAGNISYPAVYTFINASEDITSANSLFSTAWDSIFSLLVNPSVSLVATPAVLAMTPQQQTAYAFNNLRLSLSGSSLPDGYSGSANPGFIYDANSGKLGYQYQMSPLVFNTLNSTAIPILKVDRFGNVMLEQHADGHYYFATTTAQFAAPSDLLKLYTQSLDSVRDSASVSAGFQIGGPGQFNINAVSLDLGSSAGIESWGIGSGGGINAVSYASLAPSTPSGAAIHINVSGDLSLLTSTIATFYGGDLTINSGGGVYLSLGDFSLIPPGASIAYGIFTSGHSDVSVVADNDVNVGGSRIAAFNGGNVYVRSENGSVNAGNGANSLLVVPVTWVDPATGDVINQDIEGPRPSGSGILAISPTPFYRPPGYSGLPGNITVETPHGDIVSTLGGIEQYALNGSTAPGPTITLIAGTPASDGMPPYPGNVDLGLGGVVGGTINVTAQGSISGLIVSHQNANINAAQSFSGTLLAGGAANVTASAGTVSGTIIGIGAANVSGGQGVTASVLSQNASVGGQSSQSTLGATAAPTASSQAAAQQANAEAQEQLSKDASQEDDKKKKKSPVLTKRVGRVTVILPKGT